MGELQQNLKREQDLPRFITQEMHLQDLSSFITQEMH